MESKIKILIIQNNAILADKKANFDKVTKLLEPYHKSTPDLIILPELWNVGWYCKYYPKVAENIENSETISFLKKIAKDFKSNILGGSFVRKHSNEELRNTCPVIDRNGELIAHYDKMHLYTHLGADEGKYATVGTTPVLVTTDIGKIGLTICYDIRFPELFRKYTLSGADIIVNMAAWPKTRKNHWVTLQKARAIENQTFMIAVSQTGLIKDEEYNLGHSMLIDPYGEIINSLQEEEAVLECEIDLREQISLRAKIPTLLDIQNNYNFMEE